MACVLIHGLRGVFFVDASKKRGEASSEERMVSILQSTLAGSQVVDIMVPSLPSWTIVVRMTPSSRLLLLSLLCVPLYLAIRVIFARIRKKDARIAPGPRGMTY